MSLRPRSPTRRRLLLGTGATLASTLAGTFSWLHARQAAAASDGRQPAPIASPYGPIAPVADRTTGLPLLQLPAGFQYRSFGWSGDPMADGQATPNKHDGMGVVGSQRTAFGMQHTLVRNHERVLVRSKEAVLQAPAMYSTGYVDGIITLDYGGTPVRLGADGIVTNPYAPAPAPFRGYEGGGTTTLGFDDRGWMQARASLGGTFHNCAGGPTPWGTWLSCEESTLDFSAIGGARHGYVFEVHPDPTRTRAVPIIGMGRFRHEAAAVDPGSGTVYMTEDNFNLSALYRYVPGEPLAGYGSLHRGGKLQAARIRSILQQARPSTLAQANDRGLLDPAIGDVYELEWVDIVDPDAGPRVVVNQPGLSMGIMSGPAHAAMTAGCARVSRGEGMWCTGEHVFIADTSAGRSLLGGGGGGQGAVWELSLRTMRLRAVFVSGHETAGSHLDNLTVSPRGGVLLCEDGGAVRDAFGEGTRLMGLGARGESYIFAKNHIQLTAEATEGQIAPGDYRASEFVGCCFDPSGRVLFTSIQNPGITVAIEGPWERGLL